MVELCCPWEVRKGALASVVLMVVLTLRKVVAVILTMRKVVAAALHTVGRVPQHW
jgi:hypothetical protein